MASLDSIRSILLRYKSALSQAVASGVAKDLVVVQYQDQNADLQVSLTAAMSNDAADAQTIADQQTAYAVQAQLLLDQIAATQSAQDALIALQAELDALVLDEEPSAPPVTP